MASWETLVAFATVTILVAYFPGPALLYTAAQTISHGRKAGLMAMLGIHLGCYVHVVAAAFGLSAVFKHVPELYLAVKIAGALYLVWLGIGMIRARLAADDVALPRFCFGRGVYARFPQLCAPLGKRFALVGEYSGDDLDAGRAEHCL